jgi:uncharacterized protein (DUF2126 family)/transglutaminase-like putative cysteine protease
MGIRVALRHVSKYSYDRTITLNPHVVRLRPAPHARTLIPAYSLRVEPEPHFLNWQQDPYSNHLARIVFLKPAQTMTVTVDLVADLVPINPFDFFVEESAQTIPFKYDEALARELVPYLEKLPAGPLLQQLIAAEQRSGERTVDYLVALNRSIYERVKYVIRHEPGVQAPEETLTLASGSCRDSSWLLVQLARHLGLAARFCSGYLIQLVADEKPLEGPEGPTVDFTDLHAWAEIYIPGAGWVGLDPTSGLLASEGHIPLACSADPQTAAPISGSFTWEELPDVKDDKVEEKFGFEMTVTRLEEAPRVTLPYTDRQWQAINALGRSVDRDLREWDVRLTMGGEPTFVGIDDRDAEEWNTGALGPVKRERAVDLLKRLRDRFAPQALLHFGQGKWYPGESLPRWAFGCYWRRDREPIWQDSSLIAEENGNYGYTAADAHKFVTKLAAGLEVDVKFAIAGFEDAVYHLWRERRLPSNVDPLDNKLENPEDRARLIRIFEQGLKTVVGYALPLRRSYAGPARWESGSWFLRGEHMFLLPGDSPMGYRLPLESLPWESEDERQFQEPLDPFAPRGPLPKPAPIKPSLARGERQRPVDRPLNGVPSAATSHRPLTTPTRQPAASIVRTALCVEARGGTMHVFMPPVRFLEDYLDLVAAIEATAAELEMPVRIEGYRPPSDPRINSLNVTPDPGVIEVNVHPVHSWEEAVENTEAVYEDARLSRLAAEKFMLDGRHTGTGGGNHVVLGGPTPADSPFLRRPDLLRSLVGFWVNHPSLSYLFSGMFVGPTSQHPRVDEARHDALRELEIAFSQLPPAGAPTPPAWLVDRLFRHLLVDATGNTHRTEFCIDKLYSPDTAEGRRGLVELRAFEMPPHARMSCAQQLLLRALVSWFWRKPYERPLVRWETALHDRFMLPHFVADDLEDVLGELRDQGGYAFDPGWFTPHIEFRFPLYGSVTNHGVDLELRAAIEPWHVLGEEVAGSGTARYVDSSVERVQVKVQGLTDPRHIVTCNGRRVPLHPTGTNGEFVAGVRYRAWQPPSCLHPTIGVHSPLVFDVLDTWNDRSIGGCVYHVTHPGGRAHETFPVNAREAEGRRLARFFAFGHTPGSVTVPPAERNNDFPFTLDLRHVEPALQTASTVERSTVRRTAAVVS